MAPRGDKNDYGYHESEGLKCAAKCVTMLIAVGHELCKNVPD